MTSKVSGWLQKWIKFGSLALIVALIIVNEESALAQSRIVPDDTLGDENSQVRSNVEVENNPAEIIEGGARRGANLFHSFSEFNVESGRGAYFSNPIEVDRIFSRVTGSNPSEIFGTLGVLGNADLFLINPNGIVFGENARLDLDGSFFGSTASSVLFEGVEFSALNPERPPLLTVNVPVGLEFQAEPEDVINRSIAQSSEGEVVGLEVLSGENLTFVGGNINFNGGNLTAKGGNIELISLSSAGIVTINADNNISLAENLVKADVNLTDSADINVSGVGEGNIFINAQNLNLRSGELDSSLIQAGIQSNSISNNVQAGNININVDESIILDRSSITNEVAEAGAGNSGNITIDADSISLLNGGGISTSTLGRGNAGDINISATGNLDVDGENLSGLPSGIASLVNIGAEGDAGGVKISANNLTLTNGGQVSATTLGKGNAGLVDVTTTGNIILDGGSSDIVGLRSSINSGVNVGAVGNAGGVSITAKNLTLTNGGEVSATTLGQGNAGNVNINAQESIFIEGQIIEINTPDVDRDRDLVQLPDRPTETEIVQTCSPEDAKSSFVIKGSGGLPPDPKAAFDSTAIDVDWVNRPDSRDDASMAIEDSDGLSPDSKAAFDSTAIDFDWVNRPDSRDDASESVSPHAKTIVEAQGWIVNENDRVVLVADNANSQSWQNSPQCTSQSLLDQGDRSAGRKSNPKTLIASTKSDLSTFIPQQISIDRFEIEGNQVFDSEELAKVLAPFRNKPLSFSDLLQARKAVSAYYIERGYITSGAYIPPQKLQNKVLKLQVVEGYIDNIEVTGNKRLNSDYFRRRIEIATGNSLQREELLAALQLLQQDPLTTSVSAELETGTQPGASILAVEVTEANSFQTPILLDNNRNPSVGSFRRQLAIREGNLLGFGDNLSLAYSNTEGSNAFDGSYAVPFNARNGTVILSGGLSSSEVVEEPFNQLNILGDSQYYELSLRQPLIQTPTQEFAFGVTASRRNSDISSLLTEFDVSPSEFSPGANEQGETRVSALRFFQEWTSRSDRQVIAARSQFNLGLDIFGATVNDNAPDSRFFSWQGQAQWTRQLAADTLFILQGGVQLSPNSLLASEQFGLGGLSTVRGYRQDLLLSDNAAFASAEVRLPIFRIAQIDSIVQLAPFFDMGTAGGRNDARSEPNTLASVGLGLRLLISNLTARVDWGIPLISVNSEKKSWQENGLYFSLEYSPL